MSAVFRCGRSCDHETRFAATIHQLDQLVGPDAYDAAIFEQANRFLDEIPSALVGEQHPFWLSKIIVSDEESQCSVRKRFDSICQRAPNPAAAVDDIDLLILSGQWTGEALELTRRREFADRVPDKQKRLRMRSYSSLSIHG